VEMETAAVARVSAAQGIPFLGLRSVSDPWNEELAFSLDDFCDEARRIRLPKVVATIIKRPGIVPQLLRLARNSRLAAKGLARAMERLLEKI
jgi:adenosylhomocysteine nucleosidase